MELLTVIGVIMVMAALSVPAISSLHSSGKMNQSVAEIAGLLENARQYAVSKNTYVWVAFHSETTAFEEPVLMVAVFASKDGTHSGASGVVPGSDLELVSRVRSFSQLQRSDAGEFRDLEGMPTSPTTGADNDIAPSSFQLKIPGRPEVATFSHAVEFLPTGEARNGAGPIDLLEFSLRPRKPGDGADTPNVAVFRVNGLTGQTQIYRR